MTKFFSVAQVSKVSIIAATILAIIIALSVNVAFNNGFGAVIGYNEASTINNVFDATQSVIYAVIKVIRNGRLNRYDAPFLIGNAVSLFF